MALFRVLCGEVIVILWLFHFLRNDLSQTFMQQRFFNFIKFFSNANSFPTFYASIKLLLLCSCVTKLSFLTKNGELQ